MTKTIIRSLTQDREDSMDNNKTAEFVVRMWDDEIVPEISEYIKVPNKSPHFDPDWEAHGHMERPCRCWRPGAKPSRLKA